MTVIKEVLKKWLGINQLEEDSADDAERIEFIEKHTHTLELRIEQVIGDVASLDRVVIQQELNPQEWVRPKYFFTVNNITASEQEFQEFCSKLYTIWKDTHYGKSPTRDQSNPKFYVYPVDFISSVINGKYNNIEG